MSEFEFTLVPIAILIGFAANRLLTVWADIIVTPRLQERPWFFVSLSASMLLNLLAHFASLWAYRGVDFTFLSLVVTVTPTIVITLAFAVLAPSSVANLETHYFDRVRVVAGLVVAGVMLSTGADMLPGVTTAPDVLFIALYLTPYLMIALTKHRTVHAVCHILLWGLILTVIVNAAELGL